MWVVAAVISLMLPISMLAVRAHAAPASPSQAVILRPAPRHASLSLSQAVRLAQHQFKARVVRAETQTQGDRTIYVLRMLDDAGRVFAVRVDAASGSIL